MSESGTLPGTRCQLLGPGHRNNWHGNFYSNLERKVGRQSAARSRSKVKTHTEAIAEGRHTLRVKLRGHLAVERVPVVVPEYRKAHKYV